MSFLRDLVTGDGCDADIGSSSANNPLRNMTNSFLGDSRNALHANEIDNLLDDNLSQQQQKFPMQQQQPLPQQKMHKMQYTPQEQMKARNRSEMLARHLFAGTLSSTSVYFFILQIYTKIVVKKLLNNKLKNS